MPDEERKPVVVADAATADEVARLREEVRALREEQKKQAQQDGSKGAKEDKDDEKKDGEKDGGKDDGQPEKKPHPLRKVIIIAVVVIVAIGVFLYWQHSKKFEDTDDAQIDGHISGISTRIAGTVTGVYVEENQFVKEGQTLIDLDPRDYKVAPEQVRSQLLQAQAEQPSVPVTLVTNETSIATSGSDVTSAEAGVAAAERDYEAAVARIAEAEANSAKAQADVERYRPLVEKDEAPREQFDQVVASAKALAATVVSNRATAAAAQKQIDQRNAQLSQARQRAEEIRKNGPRLIAIRQANVVGRQASALAVKTQVDQAELNLSYCKIASPVAGIVARRGAELGQRVSPGQQLLLIMQTADLWVTANYKETQLRRMHPQQSVRIHVDALSADFDGYIESMPASTGAVTSLLPPENATGNYVKVVQRLPVRIRFKKDQPGMDRLRPGMSVEPKIQVE